MIEGYSASSETLLGNRGNPAWWFNVELPNPQGNLNLMTDCGMSILDQFTGR